MFYDVCARLSSEAALLCERCLRLSIGEKWNLRMWHTGIPSMKRIFLDRG
jgi:hypothetical protein